MYSINEVAKYEEYFDIVYSIHSVLFDHVGMIKSWQKVSRQYAAISRCVVEKFISLCATCNLKHNSQLATTPSLTLAQSKSFWVSHLILTLEFMSR